MEYHNMAMIPLICACRDPYNTVFLYYKVQWSIQMLHKYTKCTTTICNKKNYNKRDWKKKTFYDVDLIDEVSWMILMSNKI